MLITHSQPGQLFVDRNPGNFIPPFHGENASEAAGIEYALEALHIPNIVICGHSDCGAMKAVLHPEKAKGLKSVAKWLTNGAVARERVMGQKVPKDRQLQVLTEQNVVAQLENLLTYPVVAAKLKSGKLRIAGWVYDIEHGKVLEYDPGTRSFAVMRV